MISVPLAILLIILALALGFGGSQVYEYVRRKQAMQLRSDIIAQAEREAETLRKEAELAAKEETIHRREEIENELNAARAEIREQERRIDRREDALEQKADMLLKQERTLEASQLRLNEQSAELERKNAELDDILHRQREDLHRISGLSIEQAKEMLLSRLEGELRAEAGSRILKHEQYVREECERQSREIVAMAIQRYAAEHTADSTVSTVDIPGDEMKGRIIGREGRNIRAFEKATGVDVIVDDTPGIVIVSGFDNVRRETAKLALQKLIQDGRIHPARIEEVVAETQKEMEAHIRRAGIEAAQEAGVSGLHERIVSLLGRLKFRTSYSQNVLRHSIEVAHLSGLMAEQLGLDGVLARRCGLLHDIGKAADHEMEGGHPKVGAELLKRAGERPEVVHAALGHHDDIRVDYIYTVLVNAADTVSACRPGARRETLEKYVKRLEELEAVASGFPGVEQAYAIQAGREIRVIVDADHCTDRDSAKICRDIAKAIEEQLTYPGEIKVTVLRETRVVQYAK